MTQLPKLKELSFLVYGLGVSGKSVVNFFKRNKIQKFKVWDDKQKKIIKKYRANNLNKTLNEVDYIVLAPGVSLFNNKLLLKFKKKIITDIDLFYLNNIKCKTIVVTGTNGKSTTCKLLEHLLKKSRKKSLLGGNIGTPILDLKNTKNSYVIIEASSFQLSHSKFIQPDFAFFLNLTNDHLDWHKNMKNYLESKLKIFFLQTKNDYAIINKKFKKIFINKNFSSKLVSLKDNHYKKMKHKIMNRYLTSSLNDENMSFVYTFAKLMKIKEKLFISSMKSFKGLPHRFEIFLKKKKTIFINDSKATSFEATKSALSSLKNIYWILGGLPKKGDKINLSHYKKNIIKCYIIGKNTSFFRRQIQGKLNFEISKNLKTSLSQIFKDIRLNRSIENSILLSPAAASFDQFKNFEIRGEKFKHLSKIYARKYI